jgi:hypothetical protein
LVRKFGADTGYERIIQTVCASELMNHGQRFSIVDYRSQRIKIRKTLREKLADKLRREYFVNLLDIYFDELRFEKEINAINLMRTVNVIRNERAAHEKAMHVTVAETRLQMNVLKNEAQLLLETAKSKTSNQIVKVSEKDAEARLELLHLNNLNTGLRELSFYNEAGAQQQSKNATQRILSFCYLSALINHDGLRLIPADSYGVTKASPAIGLLAFSS